MLLGKLLLIVLTPLGWVLGLVRHGVKYSVETIVSSSGHPFLQGTHLEKLRINPGGPLQGYFAGAHNL